MIRVGSRIFLTDSFILFAQVFCLVALLIYPASAEEKKSEWVTALISAENYLETKDYTKPWTGYNKVSAENPVRFHLAHIAAETQIKYLENSQNISNENKKNIQKTIIENLDLLSATDDYPLSDSARHDLLRYFEKNNAWSDILKRIPEKTDVTEYNFLKARALVETNNWSQAEKVLGNLWIHNTDSRFVERIEALYRRTLSHNKKSYPAMTKNQIFEHARSLEKTGLKHKAALVFKEILNSENSRKLTAKTMLYLAKIYYDTRQNEKALKIYNSFINKYPLHSSIPTALFRKGIIYKRQKLEKEYLKTTDIIEQHHRSSKWWPVAILARGDFERSKQSWIKAGKDYRKVIKAGRRERDNAYWKWTWLAFDRQHFDQAATRLDKMARIYKNTGWDLPVKYWKLRFRQMTDKDISDADIKKLAKENAWEYYGQMASVNAGYDSTEFMNKLSDTPLPSMNLVEKNLDSVRAARLLERGGFWQRAASEWHRAARRIKNESEGFILRRAICLQNTGDVPASRRLLIQYYDERLKNGDIPFIAMKLLYPIPENLRNIYYRHTSNCGLDPLLATAVTLQESGFDQRALSYNLAGGLMQVMPDLFQRFSKNWTEIPSSDEYQNPEYNIRAGSEYLAWLLKRFDGSIPKALAGYNAGEHRVEKWEKEYPYTDEVWVEHIPFQQTRMFVKKVWKNYQCYKLIYGNDISWDD